MATAIALIALLTSVSLAISIRARKKRGMSADELAEALSGGVQEAMEICKEER